MNEPIIEFRNVNVEYQLRSGPIKAVNDVSLQLNKGVITALVGESGSGKTTLASTVLQCLSSPGVMTGGEVIYRDETDDLQDGGKTVDLSKLTEKEINKYRWQKISMVFQSAQSALNPVMTVYQQFAETYHAHRPKSSKEEIDAKVKELLSYVKLDVDRVCSSYPHELSGGMKQRVMIAFSLLLDPQVIILDEPTTALDVITQDYIFRLLRQINRERNISMLLLTHDMGIVAKFSDYVGVMYAGRLMEYGKTADVFKYKYNPYTEGLITATPKLKGNINDMKSIKGNPPNLKQLPDECVFSPRCDYAFEKCYTEEPQLTEVSSGHLVKCCKCERWGK